MMLNRLNETIDRTKRLDIAGEEFARLTAVAPLRGGRWLCECDCGFWLVAKTGSLRSGGKLSCGCLTSYQKGTPEDDLHELTQEEVADLMGLSIPTVQKIEWKAIRKLRHKLRELRLEALR